MQLEAQVSNGQDNNDNHKNKPDGKPHTDESTKPSHGKENLGIIEIVSTISIRTARMFGSCLS